MSAVQRLLPVMPTSRSSGFSQIAVIPSAIAANLQRLVAGDERTLEYVLIQAGIECPLSRDMEWCNRPVPTVTRCRSGLSANLCFVQNTLCV